MIHSVSFRSPEINKLCVFLSIGIFFDVKEVFPPVTLQSSLDIFIRGWFPAFLKCLRGHNSGDHGYRPSAGSITHACCLPKTALLPPRTTITISCSTYFEFSALYFISTSNCPLLLSSSQPLLRIHRALWRPKRDTRYRTEQKTNANATAFFLSRLEIRSSHNLCASAGLSRTKQIRSEYEDPVWCV